MKSCERTLLLRMSGLRTKVKSREDREESPAASAPYEAGLGGMRAVPTTASFLHQGLPLSPGEQTGCRVQSPGATSGGPRTVTLTRSVPTGLGLLRGGRGDHHRLCGAPGHHADPRGQCDCGRVAGGRCQGWAVQCDCGGVAGGWVPGLSCLRCAFSFQARVRPQKLYSQGRPSGQQREATAHFCFAGTQC